MRLTRQSEIAADLVSDAAGWRIGCPDRALLNPARHINAHNPRPTSRTGRILARMSALSSRSVPERKEAAIMSIRPSDRKPTLHILRALVSLSAIAMVAMMLPGPVLAQENAGSVGETVTSQAAIADEDAAAASQPADSPAEPRETGAAQTDPAAADTPGEEAPDATETDQPAPSFLEDPAAALSQLLDGPERDENLPHDLSPIGMFLAADWVVKAVMIGLALASLVTWTIWIAKSIQLAGAKARAGRTLKAIRSSKTLDDALLRNARRGGPAALMLCAAQEETALSQEAIDHAGGDGLKERVSSALGRIEAYAGRRVSRGTGILATIGSVSPFVGLFGTVWGIMNAFIGISQSQTTNLAVVAPGIAEALLATAIGLVAAIPAVVIYNVFARSVTGYRQLLGDAAVGVERLVSRDLDFRKAPERPAANAGMALAGE